MHESRLPLTRPALNSMLDYIQVQLNLPRGINGGWSEQADDRLADMLGKQKRGSAAPPLALLDAPAGTRPEQAPQPGSAKDSSSSESPEAGSAKDSSSSQKKAAERGSSLHRHLLPQVPAPGKASCEMQFESSQTM